MKGDLTRAGPPLVLPREMVLASAGSGKTYHLSSRLIGLLAMGEPPETIWASTFTRKAAAEILDRVLIRLARGTLDQDAAREVAEAAWLDPYNPVPDGFLDPAGCGRLLAGLVRSLHRTNIGTLDSFFIRTATTFAEELGLPPGWRLVEGPAETLMRSEALEEVLTGEDAAVLAELVRIMVREEARRGVHAYLLDQVDDLLLLDREIDRSSPDPWKPLLEGVGLGAGATEDEIASRCLSLADALEVVEPPLNKNGEPNANWKAELIRLAEAVRRREWKDLLGKGLGKKLVEPGYLLPTEDVVYSRHTPGPDLAELVNEAMALARLELGRSLIKQGQAMGRMAARYGEAFQRVQMAEGGFRFSDITHLLGESRLLGEADALYFRLDARIRHLLFDEFQDTSLPQWAVMEPLVNELSAGGEAERAAVMVADPKQSIYGWRGARPGLVDFVRDRYGLAREQLPNSFRSGPVLLDTVAAVFQRLEGNPVVQEVPGGAEVAEAWTRDFFPQAAADPGQSGAVRLVVGPRKEGTAELQPALLDYAAELVRDVHLKEPRASVGVLVRGNAVVAYLIAALRALRVQASGEGGTPLTDARPVNALLALLRMADHPGDRLARYHVAESPVGEMVGYTHFQAGAEANRLALAIRGRLLRDGYGATLDRWVRELEPSCDELERARLLQLVELGFRWDGQRTLRPGDFIRLVEAQRVEDPSGARVRVMTVHQAKGLQFDVVVLPQLHHSVEGRGSRAPVMPFRDDETGRVIRVYPATDQGTRALFPDLAVAHAQARAMRLRDELSNLYVAMTRARYALHMVVPADGRAGPGNAKSFARLLRAALAPEQPADTPGTVLFQAGAEDWSQQLRGEDFSSGASGVDEEDRGRGGRMSAAADPILLRETTGGRTRNLARRSPSAMEGGGRVDLGALLRMDLSGDARLRGTVVHAWCEALDWIEAGLPDEDLLRDQARWLAPGLAAERLDGWLAEFQAWMEAPAIREALSRASYPGDPRVEQELPFMHRQADGILQGFIDRLVILEKGGRVVGAEVLDFKTDLLDASDPAAVEAKVAYYRPQIDAYREAVAGRYGLPLSDVSGKLLFLRPGLVREL